MTPEAPAAPAAPGGPDFDGTTYDPLLDYHRLSTQLRDVWDRLTADPRRWWALSELCASIEALTGHHHTEAAVSARLRDLRKPKFGRYVVQRRADGGGLFRYRLDPGHYAARAAAARAEPPPPPRPEPEPEPPAGPSAEALAWGEVFAPTQARTPAPPGRRENDQANRRRS